MLRRLYRNRNSIRYSPERATFMIGVNDRVGGLGPLVAKYCPSRYRLFRGAMQGAPGLSGASDDEGILVGQPADVCALSVLYAPIELPTKVELGSTLKA